MSTKDGLSRSQFLRLSAIAAASTVVAACSNGNASTTTSSSGAAPATSAASSAASSAAPASVASSAVPASSAAASSAAPSAAAATATPVANALIGQATAVAGSGKYKESPLLAQMVKDGKLPALEQRLPDHPYVVPHPWLTTGKYGGQLQMTCSDRSDFGTGKYIQESTYGHSLLRWLNDGLKIGPGLVETWETNADQSQWTLHFRTGLKWSDGQPWSTDDIMFWWQDEVQDTNLKEFPPDEAHSGKGTLMTMTAPDKNTIVMKFDAPTPLTADRLAMWVNRGIGPRWMDPKHYLQQFHPKYNPNVDKTKWVPDFLLKREFANNPDSPTMTGWMLKAYNKGQSSIWARNPYYWAVDKEGNQLPYLDGITMTNVQDPQVFRLRLTQGKADYVHGGHTPLNLSDVSTLKQSQAQSKLDVVLWDSGSGTASMYFFNYDFADQKMRDLIRNATFRKAMSLAYNRANAQKVVYFEQGELTTGTLSPKALEYNVAGGQDVYKQWRDSAIKYDPAQAKQMLDSIGVKMSGQWRTMPDGSPLTITLDYPSDQDPTGEHVKKDELLAKDWQAIGINAKLNPVTTSAFGEQWAAGKVMTTTAWEVGDGPNHLVYPQWLVPIENTRWAPLQGQFYTMIGTADETKGINEQDPWKSTPPRIKPDPNGPIAKIWSLYNQTKTEPDETKRTQAVWDMIKLHVSDGPFFSGTIANYPQLVLVKNGLKNVPSRDDLGPKNGYQYGFVNPWIIPSPAVYDPETYYWDNPDQHNI